MSRSLRVRPFAKYRSSFGASSIRARFAISTIVVLVACAPGWAQLPTARLTSIYPPGGKQGTDLDVVLAGANLDETSGLMFSHAGITAAPKMKPATAFQKEPQPIANQFTVKIAADVPPGIYEVRTVGLFGMSNPRAFMVGDREETVEAGNNTSAANAMELPLDTVVTGRTAGDTIDFYKFTAKAGQRLTIHCWAQRIDSRMDATLVIEDLAGSQLVISRDSTYRDPLIDFAAPADGEYMLKVYDFLYLGGNEHFYRLAISTRPYIDFVFPPSGKAGTKGKFTLYGRNLPGGAPAAGVVSGGAPLEKIDVEIQLPGDLSAGEPGLSGLFVEPRSAELDAIGYRLQSPQGASNPVLIGLATDAIVAEQEPNNQADKAQKISPPCEYVGQFTPGRDDDWITFDAKKGDTYWLEVFSQRLGLPTDPYLLVEQVKTDDKGVTTASLVKESDDVDLKFANPEFDQPSDDPALKFVAPDDGTYRVLIRNLFGSGGETPDYVYRLSIRSERPDFRLLAAIKSMTEKDKNKITTANPVVRKGGSTAIEVQLYRRDGFAGEVVVSAEGLPPGVSCPPVTFSAGRNKGVLVLGAAEDAADWAGAIKVAGKAKIGDADVVRYARGSSVVWDKANQNANTYARITQDIALAVIGEKAPIRVSADYSKPLGTALAGKISIPLKFAMEKGVKGDLKLAPVGLPKEIKVGAITVKANAADSKADITVDAKAKPGKYAFYLTGTTKFSYARNAAAAKRAADAKTAFAETVKQLQEAAKAAEAAKTAAEKKATEAAAAVKAATAAVAKAGDAPDAKQAAEEAAKQAADAAKAAEEEKTKAVAAAKTASDTAKAAVAEQKIVDKRATDTANAAKPKDIDIYVNTLPFTLEIAAAPIKLTATAPTAPVKQGAQVEIPVKAERLFGYADPFDVTVVLPKGIKGISAAKVNVPKDQTAGKLVVVAAKDATPGKHKVTVQAALKFNGQNITATQVVDVTVEEVKAEAKK